MKIDLYLGFTSCRGNCIFCRKGEGLLNFPRPSYMKDKDIYRFFHFGNIEMIHSFFDEYFAHVDAINVSGNEPLSWGGLPDFAKRLREKFPNALLTLRTSNTYLLRHEHLGLFDRYEFSIYGHHETLHNTLVDSDESWNIMHKNIRMIEGAQGKKVLYFQTIFLKENLTFLKDILFFMKQISHTENPLKVVYPYFMPLADIQSLPKKSEVMKKMIQEVGIEFLRANCILINFSVPKTLMNYFYSTSD